MSRLAATMLTDKEITEFRSHFPILRNKTYLYNCSQGALSDAVEAAMVEYMQSWRTSMAPWDDWFQVYLTLRREFARFINAEPDEVAIVTSASCGINPVASALSFDERPKVVMSEYEFPTMGHIWLAQQPRGAQVQFLSGVNNAVPLECYAKAVDERTCIVPVAQVSFVNGFRSDVAAIREIAHAKGALLFLDGYQDSGTRPIDVKALGVDFYVTGALKYLLGPAGVAFLYVRKGLIESLRPTVTSWFGHRDIFAFDTTRLDFAPEARRFESGTPAVPNIFMARAGLKLLESVGMAGIAAQIERLARAFRESAEELGIASKTPASTVGPLVVLRSHDAGAMLARLAERGIVASVRRDGVRFAFHAYNTMEEVDATLTAIRENLDLMVRL